MKQISYWLDTASPSSVPADSAQADSARTELPMPGTADAVVVGAGLTGLSTAYHLALAGVRPVVLESHHVGWGASGRNGGMATTGLSISLQDAVKRFGERRAVEMRQFYNDAVMGYNTRIQTVPANFVAGMFRFTAEPLLEVAEATERAAPKVQF